MNGSKVGICWINRSFQNFIGARVALKDPFIDHNFIETVLLIIDLF